MNAPLSSHADDPAFRQLRHRNYAQDHGPPHFHVRGAGFNLLVEIGTGRIIGTTGKARDVAEVLAWAAEHVEFLRTEWQGLNP